MIAHDEIIAVLRDLAAHPQDATECGDDGDVSPVCRFRGWSLWFFNDSGQLDYLESAAAPDGRTGEYADWSTVGDGFVRDPLDALTEDEQQTIARLLSLDL